MKRRCAEAIVEFLSFSGKPSASSFSNFSAREWEHALQWLDDAGLAFYFLQKLNDARAITAIPEFVRAHLERGFAANQRRVADMSGRFADLNRGFAESGVRFAVLKGLSLVSEFCPNASLRYQGDFDYLVDERSLPAAHSVLLGGGYCRKASRSSQEWIYMQPASGEPGRGARQYEPDAAYAVELHLDIWDDELHSLPALPRLFSVERAVPHDASGCSFPALRNEDAFLVQVLHTFHHLFTHWIRISCLYEIGYFLTRRVSDIALWTRVEQRVGENLVLREFVVVVTELAARLFASPVPDMMEAWGARIRTGPRIWIENYARRWALCDLPVYQFSWLPTSKFAEFLHQQYRTEPGAREGQSRNTAASSSRLARMASSLREKPALALDVAWWKRQRLVRRSMFHALAELRYLCEKPRWLWLNRQSIGSASLEA